ncbi:flagellar filament capping protein FliD [Alkalilimnicola sp. S0819]|uniref:flagellar filament capping protein FliD n=1 Tax=Alkalilimnicola sp. S0819 TaxID=2613922 RepID=UPI001869E38E|nr:flagellar filament capping protein FliD [Alkalilimnicola sp. S0819]
MAGITIGGLASGLDINGMLEQIMQAERAPVERRLDVKETQYQAELSAYGTLKSELSTFNKSIAALRSAGTFQGRSVSSSNEDLVTASASRIARGGNYSVEVEQLAQAQSIASVGFDSITDTVGLGTLTFEFGTTDYDADTDTYNGFTAAEEPRSFTLTVDESNNTVAGLRDAINEADQGVQASIVNDGSGYRLVLSSTDPGVENSMRITVGDADFDAGSNPGGNEDAQGLSRLAFNADAANMTQNLAGQDARALVNGLLITRDSNTITGAIDGVTLNLHKAEPGSPVQLKVQEDKSGARQAIGDFVESYNGLNAILQELGKYDPADDVAGVLQGQPVLREVRGQLREALRLTGLGGDSAYQTLADVGITTRARDEDGQLAGSLVLDAEKLDAALSTNFDEVAGLFAATGQVEDSLIRYVSGGAETQPGRYGIDITREATRGAFTGEAIAGYAGSITIDADNKRLAVRVDDSARGSIELPEGDYTGEELASLLQSQINALSEMQSQGRSVSVKFENDAFVIQSGSYGSASTVELTSVGSTAAATLGLGKGAGEAGLDVAGRIGGLLAEGNGRTLTGRGAASGLSIEVEGGGTGARGFVEFYRGVGDRLTRSIDRLLSAEGGLEARTSGIEDRIESLNEERARLDERLNAMEERYRTQFIAMEMLIAQMNETSSYLSQQLENLPGVNRSNKK